MTAAFFNRPLETGHLPDDLAFDGHSLGNDPGAGRLPELIPETAAVVPAMMLSAEAARAGKNDVFTLYIPADFRFLNHRWLRHRHPTDALAAATAVAVAVAVVGQLIG